MKNEECEISLLIHSLLLFVQTLSFTLCKNILFFSFLFIQTFFFLFVKKFSVSSVFSVVKKRQTYKVEDQVPPATHSLRALIFYL